MIKQIFPPFLMLVNARCPHLGPLESLLLLSPSRLASRLSLLPAAGSSTCRWPPTPRPSAPRPPLAKPPSGRPPRAPGEPGSSGVSRLLALVSPRGETRHRFARGARRLGVYMLYLEQVHTTDFVPKAGRIGSIVDPSMQPAPACPCALAGVTCL